MQSVISVESATEDAAEVSFAVKYSSRSSLLVFSMSWCPKFLSSSFFCSEGSLSCLPVCPPSVVHPISLSASPPATVVVVVVLVEQLLVLSREEDTVGGGWGSRGAVVSAGVPEVVGAELRGLAVVTGEWVFGTLFLGLVGTK